MTDKTHKLCSAAAESKENIYAYPYDVYGNTDYAAHILNLKTDGALLEDLLEKRQRKIDELGLSPYVPSNAQLLLMRSAALNEEFRRSLTPIPLLPSNRTTGQEHYHICIPARILGEKFNEYCACPTGHSPYYIEHHPACDRCPYFGIIESTPNGLRFHMASSIVSTFEEG